MAFNVSTEAGYAVLFTVLCIFTTLAVISAGYLNFALPKSVQDLLVGHKQQSDKDEDINASSGGLLATDFFL